MSDLVTWLRVQLDVEERQPIAASRFAIEWCAAEIAAKRAILDLHADDDVPDQQVCITCYGHSPLDWPCPTVCLLALPYAERPGYDEAWRPA